MKYFSSDWHINHINILKYSGRPFDTIEEMNTLLFFQMLKKLSAGDEMYFLGDLSWNRDGADSFLNNIPKGVGFHWILGNHDEKISKKDYPKVTSISHMKEIKIQGHPVTLCHYPMLTWNKSHHNAWMLHGHHHNGEDGIDEVGYRTRGKILNVNCEFHNFLPVSEQKVVDIMSGKGDNWNYIKGRNHK